MKTNWKAMAAGLAVLMGVSGAAWGQDRDHRSNDDKQVRVETHEQNREKDRDHDNRAWNSERAYNNGWYQDREHDRDHDRGVYNGYYGNRPVYNGGYYGGYSPYYGGNYGYYGNGGRYYRNNAAQIGYQDGLNDGRNDRMTGHSFRPTHDDNYKSADRGYSSTFGEKQSYKDTYRQGYEQGYQQGYGR